MYLNVKYFFYLSVDSRYEHTYRYKKATNNDKGEIMFVLKAIRAAAAALIKILFKKIN